MATQADERAVRRACDVTVVLEKWLDRFSAAVLENIFTFDVNEWCGVSGVNVRPGRGGAGERPGVVGGRVRRWGSKGKAAPEVETGDGAHRTMTAGD